MPNIKEQIKQDVEALFANKKNANVNTLYATSDGNIFRAEHYAENWRASNPKLTIEVFRRPVVEKASNEGANDDANIAGSAESTTDTVREDLVKQYIELFDTKPAHNIGLDKLQDKITEKRLELEKANAAQEGTENK
ncbi:hypothetical protein FM120_11120 [Sphingobacterium faecium PCAi_F2.5]|nr:hypothetical protein FM120_11120 [Sphingobacterium faecium PCAi_F2.5]